jgi:hypothetical protein
MRFIVCYAINLTLYPGTKGGDRGDGGPRSVASVVSVRSADRLASRTANQQVSAGNPRGYSARACVLGRFEARKLEPRTAGRTTRGTASEGGRPPSDRARTREGPLPCAIQNRGNRQEFDGRDGCALTDGRDARALRETVRPAQQLEPSRISGAGGATLAVQGDCRGVEPTDVERTRRRPGSPGRSSYGRRRCRCSGPCRLRASGSRTA